MIVNDKKRPEVTIATSAGAIQCLLDLWDKKLLMNPEEAIRKLGYSQLFRHFAPLEIRAAIAESEQVLALDGPKAVGVAVLTNDPTEKSETK